LLFTDSKVLISGDAGTAAVLEAPALTPGDTPTLNEVSAATSPPC
jgi:hypothetical protein